MSKTITATKNSTPGAYKKELLKKKAELQNSIGTNFNTLSGSGGQSEDDLTIVSYEQVVGLGMNRVFYDQLREVDLAIQRLKLRQFGTCLACETEISSKRLHAVPWAKYCVDCQDKVAAEDEHKFAGTVLNKDHLPNSESSHPE